jgi:hypothetical protein
VPEARCITGEQPHRATGIACGVGWGPGCGFGAGVASTAAVTGSASRRREGAILLFPQGIVPAVFKLVHTRGRVWFLPLYLPRPLQWPACFVMITLGLAAYSLVLGTAWTAKKSSQRPASERAADALVADVVVSADSHGRTG